MGVSSFLKKIFGKTKDSNTNIVFQNENNNNKSQSATIPNVEKAENFIDETFTKLKETSEPIMEDAVEYASQAKDIISQYVVEKATESISDIIDSVKEANTEINDEKVIYNTVVDVSEKEINSTDE